MHSGGTRFPSACILLLLVVSSTQTELQVGCVFSGADTLTLGNQRQPTSLDTRPARTGRLGGNNIPAHFQGGDGKRRIHFLGSNIVGCSRTPWHLLVESVSDVDDNPETPGIDLIKKASDPWDNSFHSLTNSRLALHSLNAVTSLVGCPLRLL